MSCKSYITAGYTDRLPDETLDDPYDDATFDRLSDMLELSDLQYIILYGLWQSGRLSVDLS